MTLRAFFLLTAVILLAAACDPVRENPRPVHSAAFIAPLPEPRRNPNPAPEIHRWLAASSAVRKELMNLRGELAGLQQFHVENHFDNFLALDPATLDPAQLCYLDHFLERGYFRIEREILVQLLASRRGRAAGNSDLGNLPAADIAARLQASLQRDETLLIDLEAAIARYRAPGDEPFQIPAVLTQPDLDNLRRKVTLQLSTEREKIADLDARAATLRALP